MGLLSWWKGSKPSVEKPPQSSESKQPRKPDQNASAAAEIPGMNGAMEVPRPDEITVFEFGSVAASVDKITLAGYCPVSDELQPCQWEIVTPTTDDAPRVRVAF
ncbi:hypothetical protein ACLOJK_039639 [Asimina triloba]